MRSAGWRGSWKWVAVLLAAQALTGCAGFFVYPGSTSTGTTGTGGSTSDYAFVANSAANNDDVNSYVLSSATLSAGTNSPDNIGHEPISMAVTPNDGYLYVASASGGIYGFSISSGGALSELNSGTTLTGAELPQSICISPDGDWLLELGAVSTGATSSTIYVYQIGSGGTLTAVTPAAVQGANGTTVIQPESIKMSPNQNFVAVALGTGGVEVLPFSAGVLSGGEVLVPPTASNGYFAVAIDANNYLYVAGTIYSGSTTPGIATFPVTVTNSVASVGSSTSNMNVASQPVAIDVSLNSNYVYVANQGASSISQFSVASGVLTSLGAVNGPTSVGALGHDSTGTYVVALGYSSASGTYLYTIGTTGTLTEVNTTGSGSSSSVPLSIAMSH
jgi:6-phosphogluconolactonase